MDYLVGPEGPELHGRLHTVNNQQHMTSSSGGKCPMNYKNQNQVQHQSGISINIASMQSPCKGQAKAEKRKEAATQQEGTGETRKKQSSRKKKQKGRSKRSNTKRNNLTSSTNSQLAQHRYERWEREDQITKRQGRSKVGPDGKQKRKKKKHQSSKGNRGQGKRGETRAKKAVRKETRKNNPTNSHRLSSGKRWEWEDPVTNKKAKEEAKKGQNGKTKRREWTKWTPKTSRQKAETDVNKHLNILIKQRTQEISQRGLKRGKGRGQYNIRGE